MSTITKSGADARREFTAADLDSDFDDLFTVMGSASFRDNTARGGEQSFYIYPYPATLQIEAARNIERLAARLRTMTARNATDYAPHVLILDLYRVVLDMLKDRGVLHKMLERETHQHTRNRQGIDRFEKTLANMIVDTHNNPLPQVIASRYEQARERNEADIVFLTNIGALYPYARAHTLLTELESRITDTRLVLFYPGEYTTTAAKGSTLRLYGELESSYYRAKNLKDITGNM